jgi:hypothetical protein
MESYNDMHVPPTRDLQTSVCNQSARHLCVPFAPAYRRAHPHRCAPESRDVAQLGTREGQAAAGRLLLDTLDDGPTRSRRVPL